MKKAWQSKTMLFNAIVAGIIAFCKAAGIEIPPGIAESVLALGNMVLRMITKEPVTLKK